ncbi:MAG: response regulator [Desulfobacterales bacterium]|nr:response regulator [Desulfobacterales bacterium]
MLNILLIDDDTDVLKVIKVILRASNHNVVTATDGEKGTKLFNSTDFDLVISDINMPVMDGIDVLEYVKKTDPNIPVIGITGTNWEDSHDQFDDLISKPFTIKQLDTTIERVFKKNE